MTDPVNPFKFRGGAFYWAPKVLARANRKIGLGIAPWVEVAHGFGDCLGARLEPKPDPKWAEATRGGTLALNLDGHNLDLSRFAGFRLFERP